MDINQLNGKKLALLMIGVQPNGEREGAVFTGTIRVEMGKMYLDRLEETRQFKVKPEWIQKIKPVKPEVRDTLMNADYCISLTIGPKPAGDEDFEKTGFNWPK